LSSKYTAKHNIAQTITSGQSKKENCFASIFVTAFTLFASLLHLSKFWKHK